jgi:hypothetical protein
MRAACNEIASAPDFVLVEIDAEHEHVRVEKRDGKLVVRVDSAEGGFHLSVPLSTLGHLARRLERAAA